MTAPREGDVAGSPASPPPARAARGGEGSGVGGASADSTSAWERAETPPAPAPSPPLRGGRGEERPMDDRALSSTSVGRNPASVLPAPVGAISSAERSSRAFANSSNGCSRGDQPRDANH